MDRLKVHMLSKSYSIDGEDLLVLDKLSFNVRRGEFFCVLGPSGCGKSTLLRLIASLEPHSDGQIIFPIEDHHTDPTIGMVFQEQGLFPWMSVSQNIRFILDNNPELDKRDKTEMVSGIIEKVGLTKFSDALPYQLSGGMRQRVSIGRAIANESDILLMDEPFVFLDYQTRLKIQQLLLDLWQELKMTIVFVTHDIEEAVLLGDRVMVLSSRPSKAIQIVDTPFERPREFFSIKQQPQFTELVTELGHSIHLDTRGTQDVL